MPVQSALNMILNMKSPEDLQEVTKELDVNWDDLIASADSIGTLHSMRWVVLGETTQGLSTVYDGDFEAYVQDFLRYVGPLFDLLVGHTEDPPPMPVQKNRRSSSRGRGRTISRRCTACTAPTPTSAFRTSGRWWPDDGRRRSPGRKMVGPTHARCACLLAGCVVGALELEDIQGIILRQYLLPTLRHFLLKVRNPAAARALLGRLVSGDEIDAPQISTAAEPADAAVYRLHLGTTWPGLAALGVQDRVSDVSFKSFPAFQAGAAARAAMLGDVGNSAPEHWDGGFGSGDDHVR